MKHLLPLLAGCSSIVSALGPHPPKVPGEGTFIATPPGSEGAVKLMVNDGTDKPVCEVHIVPEGGARPGQNQLAGGEERSFIRTGYDATGKLKPGRYWVKIQLCSDANDVQEGELDLRVDTILNLTFQERPSRLGDGHSLGFQKVVDLYFTTPEYILHPPPCIRDNEWTLEEGRSCCSPYTHWSPQANHLVCGP